MKNQFGSDGGGVTTVGDAAHKTGLSPDRIRQLIDDGKIPAVKTPTGVRLPFVDGIDRFNEERRLIKLSDRKK